MKWREYPPFSPDREADGSHERTGPTVVDSESGECNVKRLAALVLLVASAASSGCICCPGFGLYADYIDSWGSRGQYNDILYHPRLDISRMGQPDWCSGPVNRHVDDCQCEQWGFTWKRYNHCYRYPPRTPYTYPGNAVEQARMLTPEPEPTPPPAPAYDEPVEGTDSKAVAPHPAVLPPAPAPSATP